MTMSFFTLLGIVYRLHMHQSDHPSSAQRTGSRPDERTP
jgi:hypothetical protein